MPHFARSYDRMYRAEIANHNTAVHLTRACSSNTTKIASKKAIKKEVKRNTTFHRRKTMQDIPLNAAYSATGLYVMRQPFLAVQVPQ